MSMHATGQSKVLRKRESRKEVAGPKTTKTAMIFLSMIFVPVNRGSSVFRPSKPTGLLHVLRTREHFTPPETTNLEIDKADWLP